MPPTNWKAKAPKSLPGQTFAAQAKLPKLPVPELGQTLRKLKESLKPIAHSAAEYDTAMSKVEDFAEGLAPKLHERLLKRRDETDHWLEEWWDNDAYLAYRDSVVTNVSYFCWFSTSPCSRRDLMLNVRRFRGPAVPFTSDPSITCCTLDQGGNAF
jgi:carnitine O-acetyltransferase